MARHEIKLKIEVTFDDGSKRFVEIPERVYYYDQQKYKYWIRWIEELIEKENITAKPIRVEEVYSVVETDEYTIRIGL